VSLDKEDDVNCGSRLHSGPWRSENWKKTSTLLHAIANGHTPLPQSELIPELPINSATHIE